MGNKEVLANNLKYYMDKHNVTRNDLVDDLNIAYMTISDWINAKTYPRIDKIEMLAHYFQIEKSDLIEYHGNKSIIDDIVDISSQLQEVRQQKVYNFAENELEEQRYLEEHHDEYHGQTAAGAPIEGQQPVPFVGAETVNLLVNGDSMEPNFHDGDIIEYHPQPELENGEIGVFAVNGGITMKKFRRNSDIRLESLNKKYEDIIIKETDDFSILGKVII
ncbi:MAG TPA: XRE family transcriptional regulator [Flavobacteriaceae bacterium]|nr:XRE family transcriptional regulator [Flavobacteriaceae bacterium]